MLVLLQGFVTPGTQFTRAARVRYFEEGVGKNAERLGGLLIPGFNDAVQFLIRQTGYFDLYPPRV